MRDLPAACPCEHDLFNVDENVNVITLDDYLDIPGVAKRDMRLLHDPAEFERIGFDSNLTATVEGFKQVPFPYISSLVPLPVPGGYSGPKLFDVSWNKERKPTRITACFRESEEIVHELFPQNVPLFLMCGGGGYSRAIRQVLLGLGWNPDLLYTLGGFCDYAGSRTVTIIEQTPLGARERLWRMDSAVIDFEQLTPLH